jgi:hypothetical protein
MRLIGFLATAITLASCGDRSVAETSETATTPVAAEVAAPGSNQLGERTFRDWYAVCDNGNTCFAYGHGSEGTGWVRISIPAGPTGRPTVDFGFWPDESSFDGPLAARVDGRAFAANPVGDPVENGFPLASLAAGDAQALIDAMTQGRDMALVAGPQSVAISLSGAAASMLWIDERQGRLGTTAALIRKGSRPASNVPAAPALPIVTPAAAIAQGRYGDQEGQTLPAAIEALPDVALCRADTDFNPDLQTAIVSARLDANTVLWGVPCGAGAYNFANGWFTTRPDGTNPRRLTFPSTGEPLDLLVNASYDPATRVIDSFDKGRGLGDCGTASSWTWTDRGFVLTSSSGMPDCNGVPADYWPTFWVTR